MLIPISSDEAFCQEDGTERVGIGNPISQCGIVFLLVYLPSIMFDFCMVIMTLKLLGILLSQFTILFPSQSFISFLADLHQIIEVGA